MSDEKVLWALAKSPQSAQAVLRQIDRVGPGLRFIWNGDLAHSEVYGLSREQYAHVLSTFSHKSYPKAPELCLARFDELKSIGLDDFTRRHDPCWDIPLNENLPQPVINLPIPAAPQSATASGTLDFDGEGGVVYEPATESLGLLRAAERQPPYKMRKAKGERGG